MFLFSDNFSIWTLVVLGICIIPIFALMIFAIITAVRNSQKRVAQREKAVQEDTDGSQKELFFRVYGGENNVISVTRELSRISVTVEDIEKVHVEELKDLGANGVLLVNDVVKCSFGDRAPYIYQLLQKTEGKNE